MAGAGLYIAGWFPGFAYISKDFGAKFWRIIEPLGQRLIPVSTLPQALFFGMIWGWLPCGLVYMALALATTTGDPSRQRINHDRFWARHTTSSDGSRFNDQPLDNTVYNP